MFILLAVGSFLTQIMDQSCTGICGERVSKKLRSASFRTILRQNIAFFDEPCHSTATLTSELASDASMVEGER
jgi:ABC-type multidrug transport system fused ATPase/permease subunit